MVPSVTTNLGGFLAMDPSGQTVLAERPLPQVGAAPTSTRKSLQQRIGWVGFGITSVLVALITLTPQGPTTAHGPVSMAILRFLHQVGVPASFSETAWEFTANIIMFTPLGFFLLLALGKKRVWLAAATMPAISGFIETSQLLFLPSRYPTLSDIIANSTGGWLGILGALVTLSALASRTRTRN